MTFVYAILCQQNVSAVEYDGHINDLRQLMS